MLKRFILYGFPVYLLFMEQGVRYLLQYIPGKHEDFSIGSPNIAAIGLGLLCPCIIPKPMDQVSEALKKQIHQRGLTITTKRDREITELATVLLFLFSFAWVYCLFLNHQQTAIDFLGWPLDFEIAGLSVQRRQRLYAIGFLWRLT